MILGAGAGKEVGANRKLSVLGSDALRLHRFETRPTQHFALCANASCLPAWPGATIRPLILLPIAGGFKFSDDGAVDEELAREAGGYVSGNG